ncbi:MAG TPA: adenosylmethionine--8-amino-7-oxononanoate transaminase [Acidimicrobiales bacterium]|nr:adenosylmethionine--8-amino-7-oxononanoate transaminase [Acidimicrobiales bacterium]
MTTAVPPEPLLGGGPGSADALVARDAAVVWHGFTQMAAFAANAPIVVERAEGRELIDVDGRRYLDAISSLWVITLGHRVPELDAALAEQAGRIAHSTMLGNANRVVLELAEALAGVVPVDSPHFLFASDGASAVEQALKIAFQYWQNAGIVGRDRFLALTDAYHGDTIGALSLGDGAFGTARFDPLRFPVLRAPGYAHAGWSEQALALVAAYRGELAAVVLEPLVQAASGILTTSPEEVARFCRGAQEMGVLVIADEVATGFGRTGALFACERAGVRPDLLCLGKGITGGYLPMSATVASGEVFTGFLGEDRSERTLLHGHSYGGNALAAAVALAHLPLVCAPALATHVAGIADLLGRRLAEEVTAHPLVREVRQCGLLIGVELAAGGGDRARRVAAGAVERGVLLRSVGEVIPIVPPLTTTAGEVERIVRALRGALDERSAAEATPARR